MSEHRADLRLRILLILQLQNAYTANQEVLIAKLRAEGYTLNRDLLQVELAWLDEIADAVVDRTTGGVHIVTLTGNGLEHVEGARAIPGIRCPRPEELPR